jgi:hypothetical protein
VLYTEKLLAELERKREQLAGYQSRYGQHLAAYRQALASLATRFPSAQALAAAQAALPAGRQGAASVGARATSEYDTWLRSSAAASGLAPGLPVLPFGEIFANHQESRAWAECIRGTTTLAVDGSQLPPWRDASAPIALVQAGLFENPHRPPAPYVKDVTALLLAPDELLAGDPDTADARTGEVLTFSTQVVNLRRFELEVDTLVARMEHHAARASARAPGDDGGTRVVAFYDGSLIVSFALKMAPQYRDRYVAASRRLLAASERCRVPLVGYIDTSYARDIVTMLGRLAGGTDASAGAGTLPETRGVHDALLWHGSLAWGDRTPAFISAREDLAAMGYAEQRDDVAFVYFQAALDRPPARLEYPRWVLEDGLLDDVMRAVRAEVIAGSGYPYPIEAADAVAVISQGDRQQFYALFQDFAERNDLSFTFSRKALSKSRRRV